MNYEHFFMFLKIMQKCSKLYAFSLIIDLKISGKYPFLLPHHSYLETLTKLETTYKPPQGSHLFGKGSFVTFDPANLEAIGNKHAVSDSVIQRSPIIIVVGLNIFGIRLLVRVRPPRCSRVKVWFTRLKVKLSWLFDKSWEKGWYLTSTLTSKVII